MHHLEKDNMFEKRKETPQQSILQVECVLSYAILGKQYKVEVILMKSNVIQKMSAPIQVRLREEGKNDNDPTNLDSCFEMIPQFVKLADGVAKFNMKITSTHLLSGNRVFVEVLGHTIAGRSKTFEIYKTALYVQTDFPTDWTEYPQKEFIEVDLNGGLHGVEMEEGENSGPVIWYKCEGGKGNCGKLFAQLKDHGKRLLQESGDIKVHEEIKLEYELVDENGVTVMERQKKILDILGNSKLETNSSLSFRMHEVSKNHSHQWFRIKITPIDPVLRSIIAPAVSRPMFICSKRKHRHIPYTGVDERRRPSRVSETGKIISSNMGPRTPRNIMPKTTSYRSSTFEHNGGTSYRSSTFEHNDPSGRSGGDLYYSDLKGPMNIKPDYRSGTFPTTHNSAHGSLGYAPHSYPSDLQHTPSMHSDRYSGVSRLPSSQAHSLGLPSGPRAGLRAGSRHSPTAPLRQSSYLLPDMKSGREMVGNDYAHEGLPLGGEYGGSVGRRDESSSLGHAPMQQDDGPNGLHEQPANFQFQEASSQLPNKLDPDDPAKVASAALNLLKKLQWKEVGSNKLGQLVYRCQSCFHTTVDTDRQTNKEYHAPDCEINQLLTSSKMYLDFPPQSRDGTQAKHPHQSFWTRRPSVTLLENEGPPVEEATPQGMASGFGTGTQGSSWGYRRSSSSSLKQPGSNFSPAEPSYSSGRPSPQIKETEHHHRWSDTGSKTANGTPTTSASFSRNFQDQQVSASAQAEHPARGVLPLQNPSRRNLEAAKQLSQSSDYTMEPSNAVSQQVDDRNGQGHGSSSLSSPSPRPTQGAPPWPGAPNSDSPTPPALPTKPLRPGAPTAGHYPQQDQPVPPMSNGTAPNAPLSRIRHEERPFSSNFPTAQDHGPRPPPGPASTSMNRGGQVMSESNFYPDRNQLHSTASSAANISVHPRPSSEREQISYPEHLEGTEAPDPQDVSIEASEQQQESHYGRTERPRTVEPTGRLWGTHIDDWPKRSNEPHRPISPSSRMPAGKRQRITGMSTTVPRPDFGPRQDDSSEQNMTVCDDPTGLNVEGLTDSQLNVMT